MKKLFLFVCFAGLSASSQPMRPKQKTYNPNPAHPHQTSETAVGVDLIGGSGGGIVVYPNPANDHIMVSLPGFAKETRQIRLVNSMGQLILNIRSLHDNTYLLDVEKLKKGIYFVEILSGGNLHRTKWIKN